MSSSQRPFVHSFSVSTGETTSPTRLAVPRMLPRNPWRLRFDLTDARHLLTFMAEHPGKSRQAFIVCRCPRPMRLHERVVALPWFCL